MLNTGTVGLVNHGLLEATTGGTLALEGTVISTGATLLAAGGIALLDSARFSGGTLATSGGGSIRSIAGTLDGSANAVVVNAGAEIAVDAGNSLTTIGTIINAGTMHATGGNLQAASGTLTNVGQLRADLAGVLDLRTNIANAGGTVTVSSGVVDLDGMTLTNGLLTGDPNATGFINILGSSTLVGSGSVATGTVTSPLFGLLNTGDVQVQSGNTLTLRGTITNRNVIGVTGDGSGNPAATLRASGTVALTGAGTIALTDSSGSGTASSQVVTGTAVGDTLDNLDNTISGPGELGVGDRLFILINEAAGTIEAANGTMIVNTGTNAVVNKGLMHATTGVLDLKGTITNSGTIAADSGSILIDGVTITGGTLSTSGSGVIDAGTSGTLASVTLAPKASVVVNGSDALTLQGSIVNQTAIGLAGDGFFSIPATLLVSGTVALSGGGLIASTFGDIDGSPAPSKNDTLDNINNTISGAGEIGGGNGVLTLINEAAGTIAAAGAMLIVNTGAKPIVNKGLLESTTGVLDLHGAVTNTGGTIAANGGTVELDGANIAGGTFISASGGNILVAGSAVLNGVTVALASQVTAVAGNVLTLLGSIVNHGTLNANGDTYYGIPGTVLVAGTVALSGGGTVAFADATIDAAATPSTIDNIDNILLGYGSIGAGDNLLKLRNEAGGLIEGIGGALVVNTGTNVITNLGTFGATSGTLVVQGVLDNTGGGTLAALSSLVPGVGAVPGIILLDGATVRGGTLRTDMTDPSSQLKETANGGTLDGTATAVTLAVGALAEAAAGGALTIKGAIVNHGTLAVVANSYYGIVADLLVSGSVTLSGGGALVLSDSFGYANQTYQVVTAAAGGGTLDNVDNLITGYGQLGMATLKLINETKGVVRATGGTLVVDTGANVISDKGLMEAVGGTLVLRGVVDATSGGTIEALASAAVSGMTLLDGATLEGGTIVTDIHDPASILGFTANGGTLDGRSTSVVIAAGGDVVIAPAQTGAVEGTLTNHGTFSILGNGYYGQVAEARLSGTVTLNGGGVVTLADASTITTASNTQIITGTAATDTLRNVDNFIVGYGSLGAGTMTLTNAAAGTIEAIVGTLWVNTGTNSVTNQGLMEAAAGTLVLDSAVANSGTILAAAGGGVVIDGSITNTALVAAAASGTVTVRGKIAGGSSKIQVANGGSLFLDGGALNGGTLSNGASGLIDITTNGATLTSLAISNPGSAAIVGNGYYGQVATLAVGGIVTLSGGGTLSLLDGSTITTATGSQIITAASAGGTLDNIDNTIIGYGELGNGQLTLINEAKGTIEAIVATMVLNTGSVAMVNHGLLEAVGTTLVIQSVVDDTAGGVVAAMNSGTVAGTVVLDGGTLRGGSVITDPANPASALLLTSNNGTLDGTAGGFTLAAHSQAIVASNQTLTLGGSISAYGVLSVLGNGYYSAVAALDIGGSLTLFSGSTLVLADASTITTANTTQVVTGTAPGAILTNTALITGYGMLGNGALALMNTATGTIMATGGVLVINAGTSAATNLGQIVADAGTLQLESTIVNNRTIATGTNGAIVINGTVNNNGLIAAAPTGTMTVHGSITGATSQLVVGNGGTMVLDGGSLTGGTLTNAAGGIVDITVNGANLTSIAIVNAGTIADLGNGYYSQVATLKVAGTVTLSGGGNVVLADLSGVTTSFTSQVITGATAGATLDNFDNTISGYGELGGGQLTLINEAKGTIAATVTELVINTGSVPMVNRGLMEAIGGTLVVQTVIDSTAGGTLVAGDSGAVPGILLLDGGTLRGGTIASDPTDAASSLLLTANGGTLDGTAGAVTLKAGSHATLVAGTTLTLAGAIADQGMISLGGNGYAGALGAIVIQGTVALTGGGTLALADASGLTASSTTQVITGATTGAELDNIDNTIAGYGAIGNGQLKLVNAASGTIAAADQTLTINGGAAGSLTNAGVMEALSGTLDVVTALANSGVILADGGAVVLEGAVTGNGRLEFDGSSLKLGASVAAGQTILFGDFGTTETLDIVDPTAIGATIGGFASGDGIIIENTELTGVTYQVGTGQLVLVAGTDTVGTLTLAGSFAPDNFLLGTTAAGGSIITLVPGVGSVFNHATASAAAPNPINFGQHHVGDTLNRTLSIGNIGKASPSTETLDASIGSTVGAATAGGTFSGLGAGSTDATHLVIGLATGQDGVRKGSALVTPSTDGTGIDGFGAAPLAAQTIAVAGTLFNFATAGVAGVVAFGTHHVGDVLHQALTITNTGTADGFTESLNARLLGATGSMTASGTLSGLAASISNGTSLSIGLSSGKDGLISGAATLALTSDGTGIDTLGTTTLAPQTITATAALYNYATANVAAPNPINFGNRHVTDVLSRTLTVANTSLADGFSESLDASLSGATGAVTAQGSFTGLAASVSNSTSLTIGLSSTKDGVQSGSAVLKLASDGAAIDNLGTTVLTAQTISATGTLYNYATASAVAPVNFGTHHVGDTVSQALSITNLGTADGFTEALDASIGGATGAAIATGSFTGLGASLSNTTSLTVGLSSAHDGARTGSAVLSLASDGAGIDGFGATAFASRTITATGMFFNYATATTVAAVSFGAHHVGDALSRTLTIGNTGTADGLTENLDARFGTLTGDATATGTLNALGAAQTNNSALAIGLSGTHDGLQNGTAVLTLISDGAGIDSLGTTTLTAQTIAATGTLYNYATASAVASAPVSFGNRHVGDALTQSLSITNLGTADGFTEGLTASIGGLTGSITATGGFSKLAASKTGTLTVGLASTHDGAQSGKAVVTLISDGTGIDNLGTTILAAQTIATTGTLYNYATANAIAEVDFGNHHVGDHLSQKLTVANIGVTDGFTENLNVGTGSGLAGGSFRISGAITGLGAGKSDSSSLTVSLLSNQEGDQFGGATVYLASDGTGIDGLGSSALSNQAVLLAATLYTYAAPILSTTTIDFGATRIGITKTKSLTIADGAAQDEFQENLGYTIGSGVPAGYSVTGPVSGTVVSGGTAAVASWTLAASKSSALTTSYNTISLASVGAGTSGLADTALAPVSVALVSKVYAPAVAQLSATSLNFGVVHVGDTVSTGETITNIGAGALIDVLTGGVGTITGSAFTASGSLGTGLVSGVGKRLGFALNTGTSGVFSGSATLALASHDADLSDVTVSAGPIALSGTVDNYATAAILPYHGTGTFTGSGTHYALNLGTIALGAIGSTETLDVLNAAGGLADLLSGSFVVSGTGFINNGFTAFSGLGAGHGNVAPTIALSTAKAGVFSETITLIATGSNSSGYLGILPAETLVVTGTVTPQARTLTWTGTTDTNFANPLNWNDTTAGRNPSVSAPAAGDNATFTGTGGGITGTGTVGALTFGGDSTWHLAAAARLGANGVTVGGTQAGGLLINQASSLVTSGDAVIAATTGADGSSVNVTGSGSSLQVAGALAVGNAGAGALSLSAGASVIADTLDAGVLADSSGIVTLSGTHTALTTTGTLSIGDGGIGELSVLNGATLSIGGDFNVGQVPGGAGNVDVEGTSTLIVGGNLNMGAGGPAEITVGPNATFALDNGVLNGTPGNATLTLFTIIDPLASNGITQNIKASGVQSYTAFVNNSPFNLAPGINYTLDTPVISGTATFTIGGPNTTLVLNADTVSSGTTIAFTDATGKLVLGHDELTSISVSNGKGGFTSVANPHLGDGLIGGFSGVISGFTAGDQLVLQTDAAATFSQSGSVVSVIENGVTLGALTFATTAGAAAAATGGLVDQVLCFLPDTLIATPDGEVKVQALKVGDLVRTASGADRPIAWIGQGRVLAPPGSRGGRRTAATPVIVRRHALAHNVPHYDLHVTKGHALFIDDVLIPVEFLVNHRSILWDDQAREVSLYHVELDTHDVLLANGAPAESYRDDGNRWLFQNANSGWGQPEKPPCAPVLTGGPVVDAVWQRLLERSGPRPGLPLTEDADVHLLVDGERVDGARAGDRCVFRLRAAGVRPGGRTVRLVSRAASPAELGLARDPRVLGVAVRRLELWQGPKVAVIEAEDSRLADGFHGFEPDSGIRWTDGDAGLPVDGVSGAVELVVHLGGTTRYAVWDAAA